MKEIKDEQQHKENERKIAAQESVNKYILGRALTYRTRILQEIILNSTSMLDSHLKTIESLGILMPIRNQRRTRENRHAIPSINPTGAQELMNECPSVYYLHHH